jgi:hypothetical protein
MSDELDRLRAWAAGEVCQRCAKPYVTDEQWDTATEEEGRRLCWGDPPFCSSYDSDYPEEPYNPRPAVLALFGRVEQAESALHRVARAGLTDEERAVLDAVVPDPYAQADPNT